MHYNRGTYPRQSVAKQFQRFSPQEEGQFIITMNGETVVRGRSLGLLEVFLERFKEAFPNSTWAIN